MMFKGTALGLCVIAWTAITCAVAAFAQYGQSPEKTPGVLTPHNVKVGLYYFSGGGANSILRLSANGLILVDGKLAGNYDELTRKVRKISDQSIRVVIDTDHYEDHTGTNAKFLANGTQVVAQANVKKNLAGYNPPGGNVAPPAVTYDREETLHYGQVSVQLLHLGNARSDGDTVVYFPDLKVVAVGDLYASTPEPDYSAGGSLVGWGLVLGELLKLDFTMAVPDEGLQISRADLETFKTKIDTLVSRATKLVKEGVPESQLMSQLKTDNLGWKLNFSQEQVHGFYAELSRTR
jgi:cyclase